MSPTCDDTKEKIYHNAKDQEVPLQTLNYFQENADCDDVWDQDGYIYCGHGQECCGICCTDHRITNELNRCGKRLKILKEKTGAKKVLFDVCDEEHFEYLQNHLYRRWPHIDSRINQNRDLLTLDTQKKKNSSDLNLVASYSLVQKHFEN